MGTVECGHCPSGRRKLVWTAELVRKPFGAIGYEYTAKMASVDGEQ